jgi:hypothetical protein
MDTKLPIDPDAALAHIGGVRALAMIDGALLVDEHSLTVQLRARNVAKVTAFVVTLASNDTYAVEFWRGRGTRMRRSTGIAGITADALRGVLEAHLGLRLSLGDCGGQMPPAPRTDLAGELAARRARAAAVRASIPTYPAFDHAGNPIRVTIPD